MAMTADPVLPYANERTRELRCRAMQSHFERKLGPRLKIPLNLFRGPHGNINRQSQSPIFTLPPEMLSAIYNAVNHLPSQVMLGLTCKRFASVAMTVNFTTTNTQIHSASAAAVPSSSSSSSSSTTIIQNPSPPSPGLSTLAELLLLLKALNRPSHQSLKVCSHCLTFRPASPAYWRSIAGYERNDFWVRITKVDATFSAPLASGMAAAAVVQQNWARTTHDICPACHAACESLGTTTTGGCVGCEALDAVAVARGKIERRRMMMDRLCGVESLGSGVRSRNGTLAYGESLEGGSGARSGIEGSTGPAGRAWWRGGWLGGLLFRS
jgi:hypothetical protein